MSKSLHQLLCFPVEVVDVLVSPFQVNAMLSFLEACHHKIACAVANVDNRPQPVSKYSEYIEKTKDKQVGRVFVFDDLPQKIGWKSGNFKTHI